MLSFVWAHDIPMYSGRGGTETYTIGHIRELIRRGIPARVVSIGLGEYDGRQFYPDVPFVNLDKAEQLSELDDTIIHISLPLNVPTKKPSYVIFHTPPSDLLPHIAAEDLLSAPERSTLITTSRFMRGLWSDHLNIGLDQVHVVYPFADPHFAAVKRPSTQHKKSRVLYAGRLIHEKGIYTLLEALHHRMLRENYSFTVTTAGSQTIHGKVIEKLLRCHPWVRVIAARHTPADMARLFARYDIVAVPSNSQYWHEAFGMVSVEAQHAGCRVVATRADGLVETDCGQLILFEHDNSYALAKAIVKAKRTGPISAAERAEAVTHFTLAESVDDLLDVLGTAR